MSSKGKGGYSLYLSIRDDDIRKLITKLQTAFGEATNATKPLRQAQGQLPHLEKAAKEAEKHTGLFGKMFDTLKKVGESSLRLVGIGAGIGSLVALITEASSILQGTFKLMHTTVLLILKPIGDMIGLLLRPLVLLILTRIAVPFIQFFIPFYKDVSKAGQKIADFFADPVKALGELGKIISDYFKDLFKFDTSKIVEALQKLGVFEMANVMIEVGAQILDGLAFVASVITGAIFQVPKAILGALHFVFREILIGLDKASFAVLSGVEVVTTSVLQGVSTLVQWILEGLRLIPVTILSGLSVFLNTIIRGINWIVEKITFGRVKNALPEIKLDDTIKIINDVFEGAKQSVDTTFKNAIDTVSKFFFYLKDDVLVAFGNAITGLDNAFLQVGISLDGMKGAVDDAVSGLHKLASELRSFKIPAPSTGTGGGGTVVVGGTGGGGMVGGGQKPTLGGIGGGKYGYTAEAQLGGGGATMIFNNYAPISSPATAELIRYKMAQQSINTAKMLGLF